ncbi:MAG: hypothetical protein V4655_02830 [Bdellovibrionota bacterium]
MSDSGYQVRVLKQLLSLLAKEEGSKDKSKDAGESYTGSAKEVLSNLAGLAGKGKDELIQSICREIGQATAAVLKEPLAQLLKDRKLQVTIEFVPVKNDKEKDKLSSKKKSSRSEPGPASPKGQRTGPNPRRR